MKFAFIVTDLVFGDAGKGCMTDRILQRCRKQTPDFSVVAIRYTGGSQAGHTVDLNEDPDNFDLTKRHIHSSFASGMLGGFPSHTSHYCPIHTGNAIREILHIRTKGVTTVPSVDPLCPVITKYDAAYNRATSAQRFASDTVGVGVGATMYRHEHTCLKMFVADLQTREIVDAKLEAIDMYYRDKLHDAPKEVREVYERESQNPDPHPCTFLDYVEMNITADVIRAYEMVVFEGAQGILLDRDHGFSPYVTYGYTTSRNAVEMIIEHGGDLMVEMNYVTRAYLTRHGDGPIGPTPAIEVCADPTNVSNPYQGDFRTHELNMGFIRHSLSVDSAYVSKLFTIPDMEVHTALHLTCLDQVPDLDLEPFMTGLKEGQIDRFTTWSGAHRGADNQTYVRDETEEEEEVSLDVSEETLDSILLVAHRATTFDSMAKLDATTIAMDLTACHKYAAELDFSAMMRAEESDLAHDVYGINKYLDRKTGKLTNLFLPRFAKPTPA